MLLPAIEIDVPDVDSEGPQRHGLQANGGCELCVRAAWRLRNLLPNQSDSVKKEPQCPGVSLKSHFISQSLHSSLLGFHNKNMEF